MYSTFVKLDRSQAIEINALSDLHHQYITANIRSILAGVVSRAYYLQRIEHGSRSKGSSQPHYYRVPRVRVGIGEI